MINVYRMTRCVTTLGKTMYSIDKFGLFSYIRVRGIRNTIKEFRGGVLSFSPYKQRVRINKLRKMDIWNIKNELLRRINGL